jgi:hypothetical protein
MQLQRQCLAIARGRSMSMKTKDAMPGIANRSDDFEIAGVD